MPKIQTLLVVASFLLAACHEAPPVVNQPGGVDATAKLGDGAYLLSSVTVTTPTETNTFNRAQMKIYSQQRFAYAFVIDVLSKLTSVFDVKIDEQSIKNAIKFQVIFWKILLMEYNRFSTYC